MSYHKKFYFIIILYITTLLFTSCNYGNNILFNTNESEHFITVNFNSNNTRVNDKSINTVKNYSIKVTVNCGSDAEYTLTEKDPRIPIENEKDCRIIFESFSITDENNSKVELKSVENKKLVLFYEKYKKFIDKSMIIGQYSDYPMNTFNKKGIGFSTSQGLLELYLMDNAVITEIDGPYKKFTYAFLTNINNNMISLCIVKPNGTLTDCKLATSEIRSPFEIIINGNHVYITDPYDNNINSCFLEPNGDIKDCKKNTSEFNFPQAIAIHKKHAYVINRNKNSVSYCNIQLDGGLADCKQVEYQFGYPQGITINNSHIYVTNRNSDSVSSCLLQPDGSLKDCKKATNDSQFNGPYGITTHKDYVYIANINNNSVSSCLHQTDGLLKDCKIVASGFHSPHRIVIHDNHAYVTSPNNKGIYSCSIGNSGTFTDCKIAASAIHLPSGIAIY
ncbi:hypothetical protein ACWNT8_02470 [Pigmentibacter ruber]